MPCPTPAPRVQSGQILEGRIIERLPLDSTMRDGRQVGYSLWIEDPFELPVVLGFLLRQDSLCPLYKKMERAASCHQKVRVRVDPCGRIEPLAEDACPALRGDDPHRGEKVA